MKTLPIPADCAAGRVPRSPRSRGRPTTPLRAPRGRAAPGLRRHRSCRPRTRKHTLQRRRRALPTRRSLGARAAASRSSGPRTCRTSVRSPARTAARAVCINLRGSLPAAALVAVITTTQLVGDSGERIMRIGLSGYAPEQLISVFDRPARHGLPFTPAAARQNGTLRARPSVAPPPDGERQRSGCCRSAVRCAGRGAGRRDLVPALCELLDDLRAEGLQVVGLAARDQALIDDDLLVDPVTTGVADVRFERGP